MRIVRVAAPLFAAVIVAASLMVAPAIASPSKPSPKAAKTAALSALKDHHGALSAPSTGLRQVQRAVAPNGDVLLIVRTKVASQLSSVATAVRRQNMKLHLTISALRTVSVQVPASRQTTAMAHLRALPGVTSVEVALTRHFDSSPDDPDYASHQSPYLTAVNAPAAWTVQQGSASVVVAVVDSGVDVAHPDLSSKIVGAHNVLDGTSTVTDTVGHGTFVAGVAAAATDNSVGVAGAGYNTSLLAVKVTDSPSISDVDEAAGVTWAADNGADVINLSLGGSTSSTTEHNAITYAQSKGALIVAAAGNEAVTTPQYPAAYPGVIAVGATNGAGRASFSNHGSWVTLAAPGVNIYSTTPTAGSTFFPAAPYNAGDGTSFSTPIVAGEAALLKAQDPTATSATLRTALVNSAHGYAGLGLGTGQVDFGAALQHIAPSTTPTVSATGTEGILTLSATSSAPAVKFRVDSGAFSALLATSGGVATYNWPSWGFANGNHTVTAVDCSLSGECAAAPGSADLSLSNAEPAVTSPASYASITGGFTITASSPGGGVRFLIDGLRRGFDATAPYSLAYTGSALSEGPHTVEVVECAVNESVCLGPLSPAIDFNSNSLHPSITKLSPSTFSPSGDKIKDATRLSFYLPNSENVVVRFLSSSGALARGPLHLGTLAAGSHSWVWNGKTNAGHYVPSGIYTARIETSKVVNGATVYGLVTKNVRVDRVAPLMTSVTGGGATFYPVLDGYHDSFTPALTLHEAGKLVLVIRNSRGTVRTISASKSSGRRSLTWNGRSSTNHIVPAGTYQWYFKATDAVSNSRKGSAHTVYVSGRRLVGRSAVLTKNGSSYSSVGANIGSCSGYSTAASDFKPYGVWLETVCEPDYDGFEVIHANYHFGLPGAVRYGTMKVQAYGNTLYAPSQIMSAVTTPATGEWDTIGATKVSSGANYWYSVGSIAAAGHYSSAHVAVVSVGVDNNYGAPSDFDIRYVRLTITYSVLQ
jgi:subtilisin family serine protease/flagellar hook assembly protein FlgD